MRGFDLDAAPELEVDDDQLVVDERYAVGRAVRALLSGELADRQALLDQANSGKRFHVVEIGLEVRRNLLRIGHQAGREGRERLARQERRRDFVRIGALRGEAPAIRVALDLRAEPRRSGAGHPARGRARGEKSVSHVSPPQ